VLEATERASTQRQELSLRTARGKGTPLTEATVPDSYRWVPPGTPKGSPYNVAQLYSKLGESIRTGVPMHPSFDDAIVRHRMLDSIVAAARSGQKQRLG
jgi:predicted dehydrogenase